MPDNLIVPYNLSVELGIIEVKCSNWNYRIKSVSTDEEDLIGIDSENHTVPNWPIVSLPLHDFFLNFVEFTI